MKIIIKSKLLFKASLTSKLDHVLKDLPSCVLKTSKQEILQPLRAACSLLSE